jgi:fibro-slime domain-containing protein
MQLSSTRVVCAVWLATTLACNTDPAISGSKPGVGGSDGTGGQAGAPPFTPPPRGGASGVGGTGGGASLGPSPNEFTRVEVGGWKLGGPLTGGTMDPGLGTDGKGCDLIVGVVRDFRGSNVAGGHPDFEVFGGKTPTYNLVGGMLGTDQKPVYTSMCESGGMLGPACPFGPETTTRANFDQWYRSTDGVNKPYLIYFMFDSANGVSTFRSDKFFPLDGAGWDPPGMPPTPAPRNYGFTTELHTKFKYNGGETFTFDGDDDLWVFVNKRLALDLGGLHPSAQGTIDLDQSASKLGISKGNIYSMELFHAERHSTQSHFRVDTNFAFVDCGTIIQ